MNLLVTTAGGSGIYPIIEAVKTSKYQINLILVDSSELAGALYEVDKSYKVPLVDENEYLCVLKEIIKKEKVDYFLSLLDEELIFLADKDLNVKTLIPDKKALINSWNKIKTFEVCQDFMMESIIVNERLNFEEIYNTFYPLLLKPAESRGGRGIIIPEDFEEFKFFIKRFIKKGTPYLIQKLIVGKEYNISVLFDKNKNVVYAVPRWKFEKRVIKSGSKASVIVENNEVVDFALAVLKKMNLEYGFNNVEVIQNSNGIFLLEINAGRIAAQDMNLVKAGINIVDCFIDLFEEKVIDINYKRGVCNIKISKDIWVDFTQIEEKLEEYDENLNCCSSSR